MGRRSLLAPAFLVAARWKRLRRICIRQICRLEGGQLWSPTFRALMLQHYGVSIGNYSYGPALEPGGLPAGTHVGNYCSVAAGVNVFRRNHPLQRISLHPFFYNSALGFVPRDTIPMDSDCPLEIGHDVWIGANAIVTPGCSRIGLGAIIAAGAVVTKDVPAFTVVGGNPARPLRQRFSGEVQLEVAASRWWEHPVAFLLPALPVFLADATLDHARRLHAHVRSLRSS